MPLSSAAGAGLLQAVQGGDAQGSSSQGGSQGSCGGSQGSHLAGSGEFHCLARGKKRSNQLKEQSSTNQQMTLLLRPKVRNDEERRRSSLTRRTISSRSQRKLKVLPAGQVVSVPTDG